MNVLLHTLKRKKTIVKKSQYFQTQSFYKIKWTVQGGFKLPIFIAGHF